ncbi:MAG: hypothetical protein FJW34_20145 [Acidobacteria bacterium]|nr:hypothetical protein [Acidobacteriota bacterium]
MKVADLPLREALAHRKQAVVGEWLARTLRAYPDHTARFLLQDQDPFRNPVGHALRQNLPALYDELLGAMDAARLTPLLEGIVRIRAVQDFTPSQAVGFVFLLKAVLRERFADADLADIETRIDRLALTAFDLYMQCREQIADIRVGEARRAVGALDRAATVRERSLRGDNP